MRNYKRGFFTSAGDPDDLAASIRNFTRENFLNRLTYQYLWWAYRWAVLPPCAQSAIGIDYEKKKSYVRTGFHPPRILLGVYALLAVLI